MKTTITFLLAALCTLFAHAQTFEGKINYTNTYKSKVPDVTDAQYATMLGTAQAYFIKGGDYKSVSNGTLFQWQLYVNKDNKLYNKLAKSETLLWYDGAVCTDELLSAQINKGVTEILGYTCDELVLTCKNSIQKYYFHAGLSVDANLFARHKYGNWYDFVSRSQSLPLKIIMDSKQFTLESVATEVKPMPLDDAFFALPANMKMMKGPY